MKRLMHSLKRQLLQLAHVMALPAYTYWGFCPVCGETTPWYADAWRGHYECMRCHRNPVTMPADRREKAGA
ncbi:hypothetical protein ABUL39_05225 [Rhodothermus marinus]|uniref:hypothetical protein n=1 Tax=Rhodothermus marinus TaxID=29549 RepID=UPI0037C73E91